MSVLIYTESREHVERLDVSNINFDRLMAFIGEEPDDDSGRWEGEALITLHNKVWIRLAAIDAAPALDGGVPDEQVGPNHIICGLSPGYFREKLTWLLAEIDYAIAHGEPLHFA